MRRQNLRKKKETYEDHGIEESKGGIIEVRREKLRSKVFFILSNQ